MQHFSSHINIYINIFYLRCFGPLESHSCMMNNAFLIFVFPIITHCCEFLSLSGEMLGDVGGAGRVCASLVSVCWVPPGGFDMSCPPLRPRSTSPVWNSCRGWRGDYWGSRLKSLILYPNINSTCVELALGQCAEEHPSVADGPLSCRVPLKRTWINLHMSSRSLEINRQVCLINFAGHWALWIWKRNTVFPYLVPCVDGQSCPSNMAAMSI